METGWNNRIINELYESKRYKQITDLFSYVIKIEKIINKPLTDKIFSKDYQLFTLNAIYWSRENPEGYKKISASVKISSREKNKLNIFKIKKQLIENICKTVIKNEIMMI